MRCCWCGLTAHSSCVTSLAKELNLWHILSIQIHKYRLFSDLYKSKMMCVCLFVPKDLANHWTYVVLLYDVESHRFWKGLQLFWGMVTTPPLKRKIIPHPLKIKNMSVLEGIVIARNKTRLLKNNKCNWRFWDDPTNFWCAQESLNCSFGKLEPIFLPPHAVSIPRTQVKASLEHSRQTDTNICALFSQLN